MGLRRVVGLVAVRRPHVLVAEVPGTFGVRCALEEALDRRGWVRASSPADADALLVTGHPGPELTKCLDTVWQQLPDPRVRSTLGPGASSPGVLDAALDELLRQLSDDAAVRSAAEGRDEGPVPSASGMDHGGMDHDGMDHDGMDHDGMDHDGMDHDGMDHGEMGDMNPFGVPLAGGAEDRDGLEMDQLHVSLGPVLTSWPAGLVLEVELRGDVVASGKASWLDDAEASYDEVPRPEWLLDSAASALRLAGAGRLADEATRLRDAARGGEDVSEATEALRRRVADSRVLRWSLGGLAAGVASGEGTRPDVRSRLLHLLALPSRPVDELSLPELVAGEELATVRLLVAVSSPWATVLTGAAAGQELAS